MPHAANGLWYERAGSGEPVVLIHEGVVDSRIWAPVLPKLAEHFDVVTYDQRAYGRSDGWDGPYSLVDDLTGVLDELEIADAALVGASRGGRIALDTALTRPERVAKLALVGSGLPGHAIETGETAEQEARWEAAEERGDLAELAAIDLEVWAPLGADEELRPCSSRTPRRRTPTTRPSRSSRRRPSAWREIQVPTLVVTGDHDLPAINEVGDILEREIADAQRVVIAKADHMIRWRSPDQVAAALIAFLR